MPYNNKLTKEDLEYVFQQAEQGVGYAEMSRNLNGKVSKQRLKQICDKQKIDVFGIKKNKRLEELETKMVAKWGAGWTNPSSRRSYLYQAMRSKYRTKKANSVRRGIPFDIDFGEIDFPLVCPVLGLDLDYFTEEGWSDNSPSFDRIDPNKGYIRGNVAIISMRANRLKNNGTAEEHQKIAQFMLDHAS
jgi:hypothetical protein